MIAVARRAALDALIAIESGQRDLGDALDTARRGVRDPRDLALLHELVTGTQRWQGQLDWVLAGLLRQPLARLDDLVRQSLRLGAYQLRFLTRVPASAVVNDAVALVRAGGKSSAAGLVNAVLRKVAAGGGAPLPERPVAPLDAAREAWVTYLSVHHAHPAWLVERWLSRASLADTEAWLTFNNAAPALTLRANPLAQATRDDVRVALQAQGVGTTPCRFAPLGLVAEDGLVLTAAALADGRCLVQDEGSQLAAQLAPVRQGHRVLDVCASPGGKTLLYAAAAGAGAVVAGDVRPGRIALLATTLDRGRAGAAHIVHLDADAALPFQPVFDVVVVDAPCSGLGTVRRDPDIKWRRQPADLARFAVRQRDLLRRAAAVVAPGGRLVYTTCSTEPEENGDVVAAVLAELPDFRRVMGAELDHLVAPFLAADGTFTTQPVRDGLEGYFGVVLERTAGSLAPGQPM